MNLQQVADLKLLYEAVYDENLREKVEEYNSAVEEYIDEDAQKVVGQALDAAAKNPVIKAIGSVIAPAGKGRKTPTATSGGYRSVKEDVDIFDVILEHLVAEGYADTNEAALAIMANMSEEWKQSIVEGSTGFSVPSRIDDFNNRRDELKNRYKQDVGPRIPGPSGGGQYGEPPAPKAMGVRLARGTSSSKRGVESKNNA